MRPMLERWFIGIQKKVSLHTLRHTFATELYMITNDLRKVQKTLGIAAFKPL
jgi:site-specific recombinase XerD